MDTIHGTAKFLDSKLVEVDGERYTADHILIAVGGEPTIPDIPGAQHGITSDGFFELETLPKSVSLSELLLLSYYCPIFVSFVLIIVKYSILLKFKLRRQIKSDTCIISWYLTIWYDSRSFSEQVLTYP